VTNYVIIKLLKCKRPKTIKWAMDMIDRANKDGMDDIAEMIDDCLDWVKPTNKQIQMNEDQRLEFMQNLINKFMNKKDYWVYFVGGRIYEMKLVIIAKGRTGLKLYTKNFKKDILYEAIIEDANATTLKQLAIGRNEETPKNKPQYVKIWKGIK